MKKQTVNLNERDLDGANVETVTIGNKNSTSKKITTLELEPDPYYVGDPRYVPLIIICQGQTMGHLPEDLAAKVRERAKVTALLEEISEVHETRSISIRFEAEKDKEKSEPGSTEKKETK